MRVAITLLVLLCAGVSAVTGEDRGWKNGGPWIEIDSGQMVGRDQLHTPDPDLAETEAIAVEGQREAVGGADLLECVFRSILNADSDRS
jgi:hypothetical protein